MSAERVPSGPNFEVDRGTDPAYYCTRLYLVFLQGLFKQMKIGQYQWSEDQQNTEITITDQSPFPRDELERRPALVTVRGPMQFGNLSLDNMRSLDAKTGTKERTDVLACTMSIHCLAKVGPEAQRLGWFVMRHLRTFKSLLQRAGLTKVGDDVSLGPETPPGELISPISDNEIVMVSVQSPFFVQWTESVTPEDEPLLRSIQANISIALGPINPSLTSPLHTRVRPPSMRGVQQIGQLVPIDRIPFITVKT